MVVFVVANSVILMSMQIDFHGGREAVNFPDFLFLDDLSFLSLPLGSLVFGRVVNINGGRVHHL